MRRAKAANTAGLRSTRPSRDFHGQPDQAAFFNDLLRNARAAAYRDAEGFQEVLFAVEKLGSWLCGQGTGMGAYRSCIQDLAAASPLAKEIPARHPNHHIPFAELYESVRLGRNDALHQGAVARQLTMHAVQLALVLEDALKVELNQVRHYMVQEPVRAELWHPISVIRQQMLANSYTYLPVLLRRDGEPVWSFVSDDWVARYLGAEKGNCGQRLATTLEEALEPADDKLEEAGTCHPHTSVADALQKMRGKPLLVVDSASSERLLGMITPYDLL